MECKGERRKNKSPCWISGNHACVCVLHSQRHSAVCVCVCVSVGVCVCVCGV